MGNMKKHVTCKLISHLHCMNQLYSSLSRSRFSPDKPRGIFDYGLYSDAQNGESKPCNMRRHCRMGEANLPFHQPG